MTPSVHVRFNKKKNQGSVIVETEISITLKSIRTGITRVSIFTLIQGNLNRRST